MLNRKIWLNREKIGESVALLLGELAAKTILVHQSLALRLGHLTEIAKGASDEAPTILGKAAVLFQSAANLLPLRRSEMFHVLRACEDSLALIGRHVVQLRETVAHALLRLCRKVAEARFILKRALLLCGRKIAVTCHPLRQVLLVSLSAVLSRDLGRTRYKASRLPCHAHGRRLGRNHRRCRR